MKKTIAIDIGGTNTRLFIFNDDDQKILFQNSWATKKSPVKNFEKIINTIFQNNFENIKKIGISAPGPADYQIGRFEKLPNLQWKGFNFKKYLFNNLASDLIIKANNDANLMALAYHKKFNLKEKDVSLFFTISTGIGAGIIINGKIFEGQFGHAAEVQYSPTTPTSSKNNKDLQESGVEGFASGSGLEWIAKQKNVANTTKELFEKYNHSQAAKEIIDLGIEALANLIATSIGLINPGFLFFSGSVAHHNRWYVEKAISIAKTRIPKENIKGLKVVNSEIGDEAAILGAFHYVNEKM